MALTHTPLWLGTETGMLAAAAWPHAPRPTPAAHHQQRRIDGAQHGSASHTLGHDAGFVCVATYDPAAGAGLQLVQMFIGRLRQARVQHAAAPSVAGRRLAHSLLACATPDPAAGAGPQLVQMFIGDGAKLVRDAFALAKEKSPCIIFIDEIDAIGTKRFDSELTGDREVQRTMLELLNQLDGFSSDDNIKACLQTHRPADPGTAPAQLQQHQACQRILLGAAQSDGQVCSDANKALATPPAGTQDPALLPS